MAQTPQKNFVTMTDRARARKHPQIRSIYNYGSGVLVALHIFKRTVKIILFQPKEEIGERYTTVTLKFQPGFMMSLTHLSHEELMALKEILNYAIDLAEPICEALDQETIDAYQRGEGISLARLYRQPPIAAFLKRVLEEHGESLRSRSPVSALIDRGTTVFGQWKPTGHLGRMGKDGLPVPELPPEDLGSDDDEPETWDD